MEAPSGTGVGGGGEVDVDLAGTGKTSEEGSGMNPDGPSAPIAPILGDCERPCKTSGNTCGKYQRSAQSSLGLGVRWVGAQTTVSLGPQEYVTSSQPINSVSAGKHSRHDLQ